MTDVTTTPDTTESTKKRIATREWINAAGDKVPTGSADVAGVRYTYLSTGGSVEYKYGASDQLDRQFAAMGAVTKLGNIVNTITNDESYDGRDPMPELVAWLAEAMKPDGQWREPGEGVARGPKYDKSLLATVLLAMLGAKAAGDFAYYLAKLDDKSYYAKVRANSKVMAEYAIEFAKRGGEEATVDNLA